MAKSVRALLSVAIVVFLALSSLIGWGAVPASAVGNPVLGSGTVVCDVLNGGVKFSPALSLAPTSGTVKWTLQGSSCGNVGESTLDGLTVTAVTIKGTGTFTNVDQCFDASSSGGSTFGSATATYKVRAGASKLMPSTLADFIATGSQSQRVATLYSSYGSGSFRRDNFGGLNYSAVLALFGGLCGKSWKADPRGSYLIIG